MIQKQAYIDITTLAYQEMSLDKQAGTGNLYYKPYSAPSNRGIIHEYTEAMKELPDKFISGINKDIEGIQKNIATNLRNERNSRYGATSFALPLTVGGIGMLIGGAGLMRDAGRVFGGIGKRMLGFKKPPKVKPKIKFFK